MKRRESTHAIVVCASPKGQAPSAALRTGRKQPARDISAVGQVEVRGNEVLFYEPLASQVKAYCTEKRISPEQFLQEAVNERIVRDAAAKERKAAKAKKTSRGERAQAMM